jgi:hypothetical protein
MTTTAPFDYAAHVRERQAKEQREAATLRIKVRGVARLLGGRFIEDDERSSHTIELAPTVHLWARRDWQKKGMIHWGARCPAVSSCSCPSVCTALARPVAAIAADVQRRLVPAAHAACKAAMANAARERDSEHARNAKLAQLEEILGPMRYAHDGSHYADGFSIQHHELLTGGYRGEYRAEVRVRSWHCLLMIAKLVAEDARIAARSTEDNG